MTRRVGVYTIDPNDPAQVVKINTILVEDDVLADPNYWPGYGIALIDEGEELVAPPVFTPTGRPKEWMGLLDVKLSQPIQTGDTVDLQTGKVTPAPLPDPVVEIDPAPIDIQPTPEPVVIAGP